MNPHIDDLIISLQSRQTAVGKSLRDTVHGFLRRVDDFLLRMGHAHIRDTERKSRERAPLESELFHVIEQIDRLCPAKQLVAVRHHTNQPFL